MNLSGRLEGIEAKVQQMASKLDRLRQERDHLLEENKTLRNKLVAREQQLANIEEQLHNTQALWQQSEGSIESERKTQWKNQIDTYIAEIDKCIEWLNNSK